MLRLRIGRLSSLAFGLAGLALLSGAAQDVRTLPEALVLPSGLAFSKDGQVFHVIGESPGDLAKDQHVRAVTYNSATGAVLHIVNLEPDTTTLSVTSDGRVAIVATRRPGSGEHLRLALMDTESGKTEELPLRWYHPEGGEDDWGLEASLSGDGRLVSIYSESDSAKNPLKIDVYDWPSKTLVATRTSEYIAAGGLLGGGVTVDGRAVEFVSNRSGKKVVELKTGSEMARYGPDSVRSPDGRWVVELPDQSYDDSGPREVLIKDGASGETRGRIEGQVADDEAYGQMTGAFCGTTGPFILASGHRVTVYAIPSGGLVASFPAETWRDPGTPSATPVSVACSPAAMRVAVLAGGRLTLHDLK